MPYLSETSIMDELTGEAIAAFAAGLPAGGPVLFAELRHLGGAVGRRAAHGGAVGALRGEYLMFAAGLVMAPELAPGVRAALDAFGAGLAPWANGSGYLNFAESAVDAATLYGEDQYARLRAIRTAVDPDGVMHGNHAL